jgi:hypothetical protein
LGAAQVNQKSANPTKIQQTMMRRGFLSLHRKLLQLRPLGSAPAVLVREPVNS